MSDKTKKEYVDSLAGHYVLDNLAGGDCVYVNTITGTATSSSGLTLSTAGHLTRYPANISYLSEDEKHEFDTLQEEHKHNVKIERIRIFKSMPATMRQLIIDDISIFEYYHDIENVTLDKNPRLIELTNKASPAYISTNGSISEFDHWNYTSQNRHGFILKYLSKQELIDAHVEQSLEESLLNTKTDSI